MRKLGRKWAFTASMVADAPEHAGLYALWRDDRLVFLGRADGGSDTIRARLAAHLERALRDHERPGERERAPTHYSWEITTEPRLREAQAMAELGLGLGMQAA